MFKPNAEHIEELMRAKEICESLIDEIQDDDYLFLMNRARLNSAAAAIDNVLDSFTDTIEALTP
jgi:hypothetical protein